MRADDHRAKALRIERSLQKLGTDDFEAVIEGAMLAGTHWMNLLLHRVKLLPENSDAMHAEFLSMGVRRQIAVLLPDALAALDRIEQLRTLHVRGDMPEGAQGARTALECLSLLRHKASEP
jgi:hypothetical protein